MKTKYKATRWLNCCDIEPVEVSKETASTVTIGGRRHAKESDWFCFCDTWEGAKEWLLKEAEGRLISARRSLATAQSYHGNVIGMKQPQPSDP